MTETELRALVRDVIAHQLAERRPETGGGVQPSGSPSAPIPVRTHMSHGQFVFPTPEACIIEPSVPCTHCGYCKSYGH